MFQVAVVIFREILEISILLSLFSAVAGNIKDFRICVFSGILLGIFGASIIAFFTEQISDSLDGMGSEIFESVIILTTVVMLCSTLVWMKNYSKKLKASISEISEGIESGNISRFLFVSLVATTIFREGSEIVLIIHSITQVKKSSSVEYLNGFLIGVTSGILVGAAIYYGLFKLKVKYLFKVSSIFMTFIAAGLAAEAARILSSIGFLNILNESLWDTSYIASDDSILGKILKVSIGYSARPSGIEMIFYLGTILIIMLSSYFFSGKSSR